MKSAVAFVLSRFHPHLSAVREATVRIAAVLLALACLGGATGEARSLDPVDHALYEKAFEQAARGNWDGARQQASRGSDPLPRKILTWLEMSEHGNRYGFAEISRFVLENPDWPGIFRLTVRAEEAIDDTPIPEILAWFGQYPPSTAEGMIAYGSALLGDGQREPGRALLRQAWIEGYFSQRSETRFMQQHGSGLSDGDHWARLDYLLWDGRHGEAQRMLRRVAPDLRELATARMRLRRMQGGVDAAIARVPQALREDPGLIYERLRWRRQMGRDNDALALLNTPPDRMVRPELWSVERTILARRLLADGRVTDAWRVVRDHGLTPDHGVRFADTEWLAGWIALRFLKEPEEARIRFETLYGGVRFPVSLARAAYWSGRAATALKDETAATTWYRRAAEYPTTYHGQLAALALGRDLGRTIDQVATGSGLSDGAVSRRFEGHELTRAVRLLKQLGQNDHLRPFLLQLSRLDSSNEHLELAGRLAQSIGRPDLGVWVARYANREGTELLSIGYPILEEIPDGDPERALLHAVARQESNFQVNAVSRAGARGLMQLMPGTARSVARQQRIPYSRVDLTRDPEYNIRLGRQYLADMLERFDGSYVLAVAAYNAGPATVSRWIRQYGDPRSGVDDPIDWIEMVPYGETRDYIQRVLGNLQIFRHRLQPGNVAMTLDRDLHR